MKKIETTKELREVIFSMKESGFEDFFISWGFQVNQYTFTTECDKNGILNVVDKNENENEIALIPTSLLKELINEHIVYFDDVSWNDNEIYIYGIRINKL